MGLAFTAVADDPSAIFFNPAGLGWQKHFEARGRRLVPDEDEGRLHGARTLIPGIGDIEKEHKTTFVFPTLYAVAPLTSEINFGLGIFAPYGLGFRWDNAETFSGRFIAQNAVIQSVDMNPVLSFQALRRSRSRSARTTGSRRSSSSATRPRSTRSPTRSWTSRTSS